MLCAQIAAAAVWVVFVLDQLSSHAASAVLSAASRLWFRGRSLTEARRGHV
jgi:hypothetical protein